MDSNLEYVLQTAQRRGVSFIRVWCVDVLGTLKGVAFPISEVEAVITDGVGMDGSALEGGTRRAEQDVIIRPDIASFHVLPWRPEANVGRMYARIELPDGEPFDGDSREILRRTVARLEERGYSPQLGTEVEFYLFKPPSPDHPEASPQPLAPGGYYDLTAHDIATDFRRSSISFLERLGIPVRAAYHEAGPSQQEVVLAHADAVSTADNVITCRMAMKQAAHNHGSYASFMPKPLAGQPGSALHVHASLFGDDDHNLFHDPEDPKAPLSALGRKFLAGVLHHTPEFTAIAAQWINSYTRLADGYEAPNRLTWSHRSANPLVRVPEHRPDAEGAKRIEFRLPDAGSNPYLVFALVLAAGLRGIDGDYELPPETCDGIEAAQAPLLPTSLRAATDLLESSAFVREVLGDRIVDWIVANKRRDIDAYAREISGFEFRQSLPQL
ncbi:MAG: glutamine synthetase [Solirubrobacteraceae bacterium]|nr:glutamine synthetase [Solirubrobacteraceae bacterium]